MRERLFAEMGLCFAAIGIVLSAASSTGALINDEWLRGVVQWIPLAGCIYVRDYLRAHIQKLEDRDGES